MEENKKEGEKKEKKTRARHRMQKNNINANQSDHLSLVKIGEGHRAIDASN